MRLLNAALRLGLDASYIVWDYLSIALDRGECTVRYRGKCFPYDIVIVRGLGHGLTAEQLLYRLTVLKALEDEGVTVVNPAEPLINARNKLASIIMLRRCGINVPATYTTENPYQAIRSVKGLGVAVIKPIVGSLGLGMFRVDSEDTAYYIVNLLSKLKQPIYVQEYVEKKLNRDIRVFVVDGRVVAAIYRYAANRGWKTNIAQGARAEPAELNDEIESVALKAVNCLKLYYAGVDIAESVDGQLYVLEVNASPNWRGLYTVTGIDPAPDIVRAAARRASLKSGNDAVGS